MPLDNVVFWVFTPIAIGSAVAMLVMRNVVHAALFLVVNLGCVAVMFLLLDAPFLFAVQIIVYAGAIMVLFLFVIMLLNLGRLSLTDIKGPAGLGLAAFLAGALGLQLFIVARTAPPADLTLPPGALAAAEHSQGMVGAIAYPLFSAYLVPFEITSVLLLAAIVGAVVLAKRHI